MSASSENEPNLTPILDMVFQLITFFMLVINFKGAAMDLSLQLPVLGSARPLEYQGEYEPLMLNISSDGDVKADGHTVEVDQFVAEQARFLKARLQLTGQKTTDFNVPVVIRADKSTTYATLDRVMRICQAQGFRQFALSAMSREGQ